jgi:hypothetical protein
MFFAVKYLFYLPREHQELNATSENIILVFMSKIKAIFHCNKQNFFLFYVFCHNQILKLGKGGNKLEKVLFQKQ